MAQFANLDHATEWTADTPDANEAAVVVLDADAIHVIDQVVFSYSGGVPAGGLTITDGTQTLAIDIVGGGPGALYLPEGFAGSRGAAVTVTLAAGGAGITGKLNVQHH